MKKVPARRRLVGLPWKQILGGLLLFVLSLGNISCGRWGEDFFVSFRTGSEEEKAQQGLSDLGATPVDIQLLTPRQRQQLNRTFLFEIYEQVYAKPLEDSTTITNWLNVLSQGGSVEGMYRGLTLSNEYRALERGVANEAARNFFASEILRLDMETGKNYPNPEVMEAAIRKRVEKYSLFTLKRILGEKYLSAIEQKSLNRAALVDFYTNSVMRFNSLGIDYGMAARNGRDANYHRQWAERSSKGRIQWELLNRVHRSLNSLGRILIQPRRLRPQAQGGMSVEKSGERNEAIVPAAAIPSGGNKIAPAASEKKEAAGTKTTN